MHDVKRHQNGDKRALAAALDDHDERLGLSPDLAARLRNVGARVRKHVAEGYTNMNHGASAPVVGGSIFCSANDTLQQVCSAWPAGVRPSSSPRKRARADSESELRTDEAMNTESESVNRPMRSLRRTPRMLTETQSLPAHAFSFSSGVVSLASSSDSTEGEWSADLL